MKVSFKIFSNRNVTEDFDRNEEDPCDSCGKNILFGAFVPVDKIKPKIATNEAYVCKECYDSLHLDVPFDDPNHIRFLDLQIVENDEVSRLSPGQFISIEKASQLIEEWSKFSM